MAYIDANVLAVPTARKDAYIAFAREVDPLFRECGALSVVDAWGDDVPEGKLTDYRRAVQATADETVVLGWITWPDKATRDAGWEKVMQDPRMQTFNPPFDGKRMIFGGFEVVVEV
ncbi:MAG TPA: DUF1428 domain-containing protein [Caulobacter sp.]|nr:DUF1428 domain-containing protein [Caulobacter sp.]